MEKQLKLFSQSEEEEKENILLISQQEIIKEEERKYIISKQKINKDNIKEKDYYKEKKDYNELEKNKEILEKWFYISKEKDKEYLNKDILVFAILLFYWQFLTFYSVWIFISINIIIFVMSLIKYKINWLLIYLKSFIIYVIFNIFTFFIFIIFFYTWIISDNFNIIFSIIIILFLLNFSLFLSYKFLKFQDVINYIIITENWIIRNNFFYDYINLKYKKDNFLKNYLIFIFNQKTTIFKQNLINLENFSKEISKIRNNFLKNIENLDFYKIKNEIIFLEKYINKSIKIKEKIKNEIISKKYFPEKKFENYLKENLVFPLKEIKKILENNLEKIENLKNKNSENPQIILANKRLEIQKNSLEKQILILDEKIKKLEN